MKTTSEAHLFFLTWIELIIIYFYVTNVLQFKARKFLLSPILDTIFKAYKSAIKNIT